MDEKDFINKTMEDLILSGAMEFAGLDPNTGEMLYSFTNKLKETMPELYKEHMNFVNAEIMYLWEMGFLNVSMFEEEPKVTLTPKAFVQEEISQLSEPHSFALREIMRALRVI